MVVAAENNRIVVVVVVVVVVENSRILVEAYINVEHHMSTYAT